MVVHALVQGPHAAMLTDTTDRAVAPTDATETNIAAVVTELTDDAAEVHANAKAAARPASPNSQKKSAIAGQSLSSSWLRACVRKNCKNSSPSLPVPSSKHRLSRTE